MRRLLRGVFIVWIVLRYGLDELVLTSFQPVSDDQVAVVRDFLWAE